MWSSRPYIPPAPFISGERAGLELWFTLATLAGRSDTSTREPSLFAHSGFHGRGLCRAERDLRQDLAEHPVALDADPLGPGLVARPKHRGPAGHRLPPGGSDADPSSPGVVVGHGHLHHAQRGELADELPAPLGGHL